MRRMSIGQAQAKIDNFIVHVVRLFPRSLAILTLSFLSTELHCEEEGERGGGAQYAP